MKKLIMILAMIGMVACNEKAETKKEAFANLPVTTPDASSAVDMDALLSNLNAQLNVARRDLHTQPSYLPNGSYSAFGEFWCVNGDCSYNSEPVECQSTGHFYGDFSIYSDAEATFWNSVNELVDIHYQVGGILNNNQITVTSTTTGHSGYSFNYRFIGQNRWEIVFSESCSRVFHCHTGQCAE